MSSWHPFATKVVIPTAPQSLSFTGGGRKIVWHTTEGSSIEGAEGAYRAAGVCPHLTLQVKGLKRTLHQHLSLAVAGSALAHPFGPQTNRANAIQVELVGFAEKSGLLRAVDYYYIGRLARWIDREYGNGDGRMIGYRGVAWRKPRRLTGAGWVATSGQVGHMHCPGNNHRDPGTGFRPGLVLAGSKLSRKP